ncbi:MAG TPA: OmpA family protein [Halioglobus sp.]
MERKPKVWSGILTGILGSLVAVPLLAVEVITQEDIVTGVITKEQLVKVADNAVFLLDTSSSMNDDFADTDTPMIKVVYDELKRRNSYLPDLGYNFTIVEYTGWNVLYPTQPYNREKVAAALDTIPKKGGGPTPLKSGLGKLEDILKPLTGRTAVFLFSDGEYTGGSPADIAKRLASTYDICFYVISTAKPKKEEALKEDVASLNACSRLIPFADFINRPEYTSGALFDVRVTDNVVTLTDKKIVGLKVDDINFGTNKSALEAADKSELDELAAFMKDKPKSYALIAGYTDNTGTEDHNEGLSRTRADMVASYLREKHGIDDSRMVLFWFGSDNPIVANDSPDNMAKNRRVEVAVGGL